MKPSSGVAKPSVLDPTVDSGIEDANRTGADRQTDPLSAKFICLLRGNLAGSRDGRRCGEAPKEDEYYQVVNNTGKVRKRQGKSTCLVALMVLFSIMLAFLTKVFAHLRFLRDIIKHLFATTRVCQKIARSHSYRVAEVYPLIRFEWISWTYMYVFAKVNFKKQSEEAELSFRKVNIENAKYKSSILLKWEHRIFDFHQISHPHPSYLPIGSPVQKCSHNAANAQVPDTNAPSR